MSTPITRRAFVGTAGGTLAAAACALPGAPVTEAQGTALRTPLTIDAAVPYLAPMRGFDAFRDELRARRAAGFHAAFAPVGARADLETTLRSVVALSSHVARLDGEAMLVTAPEQLRATGRFGVIAHLQGLHMIGEQLALIRQLRDANVLVMQLTECWKNWCGDGCFERGDLPLTGLGRMVVRAIGDAGAVLDLAQAGRRTSLEALELTTGPVIVSRANAAAVHEHPQNLTDAQIDAVRRRNGVIGLTAFPPLVASAAPPSVDAVLRHLRHLVERAGIDHVGIGFDFDDRPRRRFPEDPLPDRLYAYPVGLASAADVPAFRQRLSREGFSEQDLQKLFGGNLTRVLESAASSAAG